MPLLKYGSSLKSLDKSGNENVIKANLLYKKQFEIQKTKVKKRAKTRIRKRKSPNELTVNVNNTHRDF
jgi:hypothetical protein